MSFTDRAKYSAFLGLGLYGLKPLPEEAILFGSGAGEGVVVPFDNHAWVVYKGSAELEDFVADINILKVNGRHHGIHSAMRQSHEELCQVMEDTHVAQWYGGGHSLGGALIADFQDFSPYRFAEVHTMGSPRWLSPNKAKQYDEDYPNTHRWSFQSDIVTRLPSGLRWRHVGRTHWHDGHRWTRSAPCLRRLIVQLNHRTKLFGEPFADHSLTNYYEAL